MRIRKRCGSEREEQQIRSELAMAEQAKGVVGRICGSQCQDVCMSCGSQKCQCMCAPKCPQAPHMLSSDPDRFPIEPAILPLVLEMKRQGLFHPCWSCEGHLGRDGSLWKLPRVWFYCDATTHLRLLADMVGALYDAKILKNRWQVVVISSAPDNPHTTFSLEPTCEPNRTLALSTLQKDARLIADSLCTMIPQAAKHVLQ